MPENAAVHALLGGTFDPIHYGHLRPAEVLAQQIGLEEVTLMPNNVPPHRPQPEASAAQRAEMVRIAISGNPLFNIDLREMRRSTPSWTADTLIELRRERGSQQPLAFIIGQDSLLSLPQWHRGLELLEYCHILVCQRPGYPQQMACETDQAWLRHHQTQDPQALHQQPAGLIYLAQTPLIDISATEIRRRRHHGESCDDLLPAAVSAFMDREGLYRDIEGA